MCITATWTRIRWIDANSSQAWTIRPGAVTQLYLATSPEIESKNIRGQHPDKNISERLIWPDWTSSSFPQKVDLRSISECLECVLSWVRALRYYRPQALHADPPKFSTYELEEKLWSVSEKLVQKYLWQSGSVRDGKHPSREVYKLARTCQNYRQSQDSWSTHVTGICIVFFGSTNVCVCVKDLVTLWSIALCAELRLQKQDQKDVSWSSHLPIWKTGGAHFERFQPLVSSEFGQWAPGRGNCQFFLDGPSEWESVLCHMTLEM